jgi:hypothetical protein
MAAQPAPAPSLSHGAAIEYKAFSRAFHKNSGHVLYLVATCSYGTPGFGLFFQAEPGLAQFELMETAPTGIEPQLVTYYIASWTNAQPLSQPPTHVKIKDAQGEHLVTVKPW